MAIKNRINNQIRVPNVRLIDKDGAQVGVVSIQDALMKAKEAGLDLVELQPNEDPPIAKLMDYGKFKFDRSKKDRKNHHGQLKVKEIKFRPSTDEGDYGVKLRNLRRFLKAGNKVKITVWFRGREMAHQDLGAKLIERLKIDLVDDAKIEFMPKLEGRQIIMILAPKKK